MPNVNNNVSVRTGEEFSLEFMQDRVAARRVPAVANYFHLEAHYTGRAYEENVGYLEPTSHYKRNIVGLKGMGVLKRLRIFLIPLCEPEILSSFDGNTIQQNSPDYQYVVAVNGILDHTPRKNTSGMGLASEANKLETNLDRIPSLHRRKREGTS
ncbi:hypothetical protein CMV_015407 [Castanea mollissima]|uniref:Uncharacterized protein n=1 Tax=Castanea mollissima TaxID=60419 RepID=A0A8J4RA67_9ROSI|nr:hypothetical protein CMV_015407 [Castanea mollissima]